MPQATLPPQTIAQAKQLLADGATQAATARHLGVSTGVVSKVKNGLTGAEIPWPNGETGSMKEAYPMGTPDQQQAHDWSPDAKDYMKWSDGARVRILEAVNSRRRSSGREPLPDVAIEWQVYMEHPGGDSPGQEEERKRKAHKAEDVRRATVMREFNAIVDEQLAQRSDVWYRETFKFDPDAEGAEHPVREDDILDPDVYETISVEEVLQKAPYDPILVEARRQEDALLLEALLLVYKQLPVSQWSMAQEAVRLARVEVQRSAKAQRSAMQHLQHLLGKVEEALHQTAEE